MLIPKYSKSDRSHHTKQFKCINDKRHQYSRIITIINKNKKYNKTKREEIINYRAYQFIKIGLRVEWRCCMIAAIQYDENNQYIYQTLLSNLYFANNNYSNDQQWADVRINSNILNGDTFWTTTINIPYFYRNDIIYSSIDTIKPYNIPLMLTSDSYINERHQRIISFQRVNYNSMTSQTMNMSIVDDDIIIVDESRMDIIHDIIKSTQNYNVISPTDLRRMRHLTHNDYIVTRQFDRKTYTENRLIGLILKPKCTEDIRKYTTISQYNRAFMRSIITITRNLHSEWRCAQFAMHYNIQNYSPSFLCNQTGAMADFDINVIVTRAHDNTPCWIASIEIVDFYKKPPPDIALKLTTNYSDSETT